MEQENQQSNYVDPASLQVRRKRGRPRKDEVPVSEPSIRTQQRRRVDSPAGSSRDLVGQEVSCIMDGTFKGGYLLTVRVGTTGQVLRGMVFHPRFSLHVSAENDIAPELPMLKPNVTVPLMTAEASNQVSVPAPDQCVHQNVKAALPLPSSEHAAAPTPAQLLQQNIRAVQHSAKNETVVHTPAKSVQQNVSAFQPIQRNEPAVFHQPVQPAEQNVSAIQPAQQNKLADVPTPALPVQQNVRAVQPLQKNQTAAVPTPALPAQQNVTVQPLPRDGPASVFTACQTMQQNVRAALPLPSNLPATPPQFYQTVSSLCTEKAVLNDAGHTLQSDLRLKDVQAITEAAAGTANAWSSPMPQPIQSEPKNTQTVTSERPAAVVFKEEEAPVTIPVPVHQIGAAVGEPQGSADPQERGSDSGNVSRTGYSAQILNANETVGGLAGFAGLVAEPQALVVRSKSKPEDSWMGQLDTSASAAPQASDSQTDPEMSQARGITLLDSAEPMPPSDASD